MLTGYNILVAEDNPLNQKIATFLLTKQGANVTSVLNGTEAVRELELHRYDVVLMDLQMPIMDGYEATKHIRNILSNNVPILALSASNYPEEIEKCIEIGMNGCISKPIDAAVLYDSIIKATKDNNITA